MTRHNDITVEALAWAIFDAGLPEPGAIFSRWADHGVIESTAGIIDSISGDGFVIVAVSDLAEILEQQEFMVLNHMTSPEHDDAYQRIRSLLPEGEEADD